MTTGQDPGNTGHVYAYNLDRAETPAGIKVRWRIRVAAGAEAERLDTIQQEAIISLSTWADKHRKPRWTTSATAPEIHMNDSHEHIPPHPE